VAKKLKPRPLLLLPRHRSLLRLHLLPLRLKPPSLLKLLLLPPRPLTLPSLLKLLLRLPLAPRLLTCLKLLSKKRNNSSYSVKTGQLPRFLRLEFDRHRYQQLLATPYCSALGVSVPFRLTPSNHSPVMMTKGLIAANPDFVPELCQPS
jgi:hypothetical protein